MSADGVPKVSVCIATYRQATYIEDCVLSALSQAGGFEIEILVGDDNSRDGTAERVQGLVAQHPRLTLLRRDKNLGGIGNYQDLAARASGDFIAHLDGDDAWLPGKLRAQLAFLQAHPESPAVYTNAIAVDAAGRLRGPFTGTHPERMPLAYLATKGNFLMHSSLLYRASERAAFLDLPTVQVIDYHIHLALAKRGPIGFLHQPLALYRAGTATSAVRHSFAWVHGLLWSAVKDVAASLPAHEARRAILHFIGSSLAARVSGKHVRMRPLLDEAAALTQMGQAALLLRALPTASAIAAHGALRQVLRAAGAGNLLAEHARI